MTITTCPNGTQICIDPMCSCNRTPNPSTTGTEPDHAADPRSYESAIAHRARLGAGERTQWSVLSTGEQFDPKRHPSTTGTVLGEEEPPPGTVVLDRYGDAFQRTEGALTDERWLPAQAPGAGLPGLTWEGLRRTGSPLTVLVPATLLSAAREEGRAEGAAAELRMHMHARRLLDRLDEIETSDEVRSEANRLRPYIRPVDDDGAPA